MNTAWKHGKVGVRGTLYEITQTCSFVHIPTTILPLLHLTSGAFLGVALFPNLFPYPSPSLPHASPYLFTSTLHPSRTRTLSSYLPAPSSSPSLTSHQPVHSLVYSTYSAHFSTHSPILAPSPTFTYLHLPSPPLSHTHLFLYLLAYSTYPSPPAYSFTSPPPGSLIPLPYPRTQLPLYLSPFMPPNHSFTHLPTYPLTHLPTYLLTHPPTC